MTPSPCGCAACAAAAITVAAPTERQAALLTRSAEKAPGGLHRHLAEFDARASTNRLLDQLMGIVQSLEQSPERVSYSKELLMQDINAYRQILFELWRLIYRVEGGAVHVVLVADGRHDLQSVLAAWLLGA